MNHPKPLSTVALALNDGTDEQYNLTIYTADSPALILEQIYNELTDELASDLAEETLEQISDETGEPDFFKYLELRYFLIFTNLDPASSATIIELANHQNDKTITHFHQSQFSTWPIIAYPPNPND